MKNSQKTFQLLDIKEALITIPSSRNKQLQT